MSTEDLLHMSNELGLESSIIFSCFYTGSKDRHDLVEKANEGTIPIKFCWKCTEVLLFRAPTNILWFGQVEWKVSWEKNNAVFY